LTRGDPRLILLIVVLAALIDLGMIGGSVKNRCRVRARE